MRVVKALPQSMMQFGSTVVKHGSLINAEGPMSIVLEFESIKRCSQDLTYVLDTLNKALGADFYEYGFRVYPRRAASP
jgi:hypothetical protein